MVRRPPQLDPLSFTASRSCFRKTKRKRVVSWPSRRKSRISYFSQHYFQHFENVDYRKSRFSPRWSGDHPSWIRWVLLLHGVVSEKLNEKGWSPDHLGENRGFRIFHNIIFNISQNDRSRKRRGRIGNRDFHPDGQSTTPVHSREFSLPVQLFQKN